MPFFKRTFKKKEYTVSISNKQFSIHINRKRPQRSKETSSFSKPFPTGCLQGGLQADDFQELFRSLGLEGPEFLGVFFFGGEILDVDEMVFWSHDIN